VLHDFFAVSRVSTPLRAALNCRWNAPEQTDFRILRDVCTPSSRDGVAIGVKLRTATAYAASYRCARVAEALKASEAANCEAHAMQVSCALHGR
jgi:hypothetical protein